MGSAALRFVGKYRLLGIVPVRSIYEASARIGRVAMRRPGDPGRTESPVHAVPQRES